MYVQNNKQQICYPPAKDTEEEVHYMEQHIQNMPGLKYVLMPPLYRIPDDTVTEQQ